MTTNGEFEHLDDTPLPVLFKRARSVHTAAESDGASVDQITAALKKLQVCEERIRQLALFSANEEADDVATADLKYLLVPFMQADLLHRLPAFSSPPIAERVREREREGEGGGVRALHPSASPSQMAAMRLGRLKTALHSLSSFLESMERLGLVEAADRSQVVRAMAAASAASSSSEGGGGGGKSGSDDNVDAATRRAMKVQRFKREKELRMRLESLQRMREERGVGAVKGVASHSPAEHHQVS